MNNYEGIKIISFTGRILAKATRKKMKELNETQNGLRGGLSYLSN